MAPFSFRKMMPAAFRVARSGYRVLARGLRVRPSKCMIVVSPRPPRTLASAPRYSSVLPNRMRRNSLSFRMSW